MARRVFWHLGLPKTGTTYLQTIAWEHRDALQAHGLLLPGTGRRQHLWASGAVREEKFLARRHAEAPGAWKALLADLAPYAGDALITHEFFCSATAEQAKRGVADLEATGAEVHLVLTAREPLGLFTSSWQESLKNRSTTRIEDYGRTVSDDPSAIWDWRALDLRLVLERWGGTVAPEHVHVITMPESGSPRSVLWERFCGVLGIDPSVADTGGNFPNESMGVVEAETLRRINGQLTGFTRAVERGVWLRSFLADDRLVPRGGDRFWPGEDQIADCRRRADAAIELVRAQGYDVVGDLDSIRVPEELPERRHPSSVTDTEVANVAVSLVAQLLGDVRDATRQQVTSSTPAAAAAGRARRAVRRAAGRARAKVWPEAQRPDSTRR